MTIKEIARLAGVSIGTVDRVLHGRGRVSAQNTARIQALVAERGYKANLFASRLSAGAGLKTIGVLLPQTDQDAGYWKFIEHGMGKAAEELEPLKITIHLEGFDRLSATDCARAFGRLVEEGCDALALAPIHNTVLRPLIDALPEGFPLVFFDTDLDCRHLHGFVGQDPFQGGLLAGKLLGMATLRGRPLALVRFDEDDAHLNRRAEGFVRSCLKQNREVLELHQRLGVGIEDRRLDLAHFLLGHPEVAGLFVPNANVSDYARSGSGLRVVGYDLTPPNVAALREGRIDVLISQRPETMGAEAIRLLSRALLFGEKLPANVNLPLDVVLPENLEGFLEATSTGPPSASVAL